MNAAMPSSTPAGQPRGGTGGEPVKRTIAQMLRARASGSSVEPRVKRMSGEAKTAISQARSRARTSSPAPRAAIPAVLSRSTTTMNSETSFVTRWSRSTRRASSGANAPAPPCERPSTSGLTSPAKAVERGPAHILAEAAGCSYPEFRHGPCSARARKVVTPRTAAKAYAWRAAEPATGDTEVNADRTAEQRLGDPGTGLRGHG